VAAAIRPHSPGAHLNLGKALSDRGQFDEAIAEYREALRIKSDYGAAHANIASALEEKGRLDEAIEELREATRLEPSDATWHFYLGNDLGKVGKTDEAMAELRQAIVLEPQFARAHGALGNVLCEKGQAEEALAEYRLSVEYDKADADLRANLALELVAQGHPGEAATICRESLRRNKDDLQAHAILGDALNRMGRAREAIPEYQAYLSLKKHISKEDWTAYLNLSVALDKTGELDDAIAAARQARDLNNNAANVHSNLASVLLEKGLLDEAIAEYQAALRLKPENVNAHIDLGVAFHGKDQVDAAMAEYRQALRLEPLNALAHTNLGQCLMQTSLTEALVYLRRGHELASQNPDSDNPDFEQRFALYVQRCEHLIELDSKLPAILRGEEQPTSAAQRAEYAALCSSKRRYRTAARLFADAFAADPKLAEDLQPHHLYRFSAACAAARAGCGQGVDAGKLPAAERARWREQAISWLRADLDAWATQIPSDGKAAPRALLRALGYWLRNADLAGLRDAAAVAALPPAEQEACRKLWADVADVLARATRQSAPASKAGEK
jgi:Flp pilus assembly protein TadD